jgi:hypothetical protein
MRLFPAGKKVDLAVVLELSRQPDGSARGQVDGLPVVLGSDHALRIPLTGGWPAALRLLPRPAARSLEGPLRNRSRHRRWMALALARPEVTRVLEGLPSSGVRIDVGDQALCLRWTAEVDGPSARRTVRAAVALARTLPAAMSQEVNAAAAALASGKDSLSRQYLAAEAKTVPWTYGALLGGVPAMIGGALLCGAAGRPSAVPIAALTAAIATFFLCLERGQRASSYLCPRCHAVWSARPRQLRKNPGCPRCGLSPTRAPFPPLEPD